MAKKKKPTASRRNARSDEPQQSNRWTVVPRERPPKQRVEMFINLTPHEWLVGHVTLRTPFYPHPIAGIKLPTKISLWPKCYLKCFNALKESRGWIEQVLLQLRAMINGQQDHDVAIYVRVSHRLSESARKSVRKQLERWMKRNYPDLRKLHELYAKIGIVT